MSETVDFSDFEQSEDYLKEHYKNRNNFLEKQAERLQGLSSAEIQKKEAEIIAAEKALMGHDEETWRKGFHEKISSCYHEMTKKKEFRSAVIEGRHQAWKQRKSAEGLKAQEIGGLEKAFEAGVSVEKLLKGEVSEEEKLIVEQEIKNIANNTIQAMLDGMENAYRKSPSFFNWGPLALERTEKRFNENFKSTVDGLGGMGAENPDEKKYCFWSGKGQEKVDEMAKNDPDVVTFQSRTPGRVFNMVVENFVNQGIMDWASTTVLDVYGALSYGFANEVVKASQKAQEKGKEVGVIVATPVVNLDNIFSRVEIEVLAKGDLPLDQIVYHGLEGNKANIYFRIDANLATLGAKSVLMDDLIQEWERGFEKAKTGKLEADDLKEIMKFPSPPEGAQNALFDAHKELKSLCVKMFSSGESDKQMIEAFSAKSRSFIENAKESKKELTQEIVRLKEVSNNILNDTGAWQDLKRTDLHTKTFGRGSISRRMSRTIKRRLSDPILKKRNSIKSQPDEISQSQQMLTSYDKKRRRSESDSSIKEQPQKTRNIKLSKPKR